MNSDLEEIERQMARSSRIIGMMWIGGIAALISAGYLAASYPGMLLGVGFILVAMAVASEIKKQIYPIGLLALKQLGQENSN